MALSIKVVIKKADEETEPTENEYVAIRDVLANALKGRAEVSEDTVELVITGFKPKKDIVSVNKSNINRVNNLE
jgi:hypothetical protein